MCMFVLPDDPKLISSLLVCPLQDQEQGLDMNSMERQIEETKSNY